MATVPLRGMPAVSSAAGDAIRVRGARVHNLRNIDLDLPRNQLVVITGPSGSGKSSLAFDTLFAEGQRQYLETLSVYARQFLHQLERPDVDVVTGLQPTICIDQRPGNPSPRSTVATVTEIYDYLRLLAARVGAPSCYQCGAAIRQQSEGQIRARLAGLPEGTRLLVLAPLVRGRRGRHLDVVAAIRKARFVRARVDGQVVDVETFPELDPRRVHDIEAVVDRIVVRPGVENRLAEDIRLAVDHGDGRVLACYLQAGDEEVWVDELFSTRYACPQCGISYAELEPRTFSFNSPYGACPSCEGLGQREEFDPELMLPDRSLSLADGGFLPWKAPGVAAVRKQKKLVQEYLADGPAGWQNPLAEIPAGTWERLLRGDPDRGFLGLVMLLEQEQASTTDPRRLEQLATFRGAVICAACQGSRLRPEAANVRLGGRTLTDITHLPIAAAATFFADQQFPADQRPIALPLVAEIRKRLEFLRHVGLDYLTLDRAADTLSGGELQRVRLATSIGSGLVGVCYVLDEPSIGLHPRDSQRLIEALRNLQQQGNTVLVVEHDEAMMRAADYLVDFGPGAGPHGGEVMAAGPLAEVLASSRSLTARYLTGAERMAVPAERRRARKSQALVIQEVTTNNLQAIDVRIPLGLFVCVTGVSGSGKSSLVHETLVPAVMRRLGGLAVKPGPHQGLHGVGQIDKLIEIDQTPIGRTPRSSAATYTGVFDEIRKIFANTRDARQRGYTLARFSFNNKGGRCETCQGQGLQKIEMHFLPDLFVPCSDCDGSRFNRQTLQVRWRGKQIAEVLAMPVAAACEFFEPFPLVARLLLALQEVGLGYLPLGQPSTTLSGGEAQRIKLATQLARVDSGKTLYVLDEPTTGLHFDDIRRLLAVLHRLVDRGNSVLVVEHHLDVIKSADWIIDLGPEGGAAGGRLLFEGPPEELAAVPDNATGRYLRPALGC